MFASILLPLAGNLAAVAFDAPRSIFVLRANKTNALARASQRCISQTRSAAPNLLTPLTIQGAMDDDALKRKKNELAAWISNGTITSATLSQWFPKPLDINAPLSTSPVNSGLLPIHIAAIHDQPECIRLLIAAGADPNLQAVVREVNSITGDTALLFAARSGLTQSVIALLRAGADPNIATRRSGRTALLYMAARGSVQGVAALLAAGANADVVDTAPAEMLCASYTPMRAAIKLGNPNVLPTLLRGGARNCIRRYERTVQKYLREQSDIEAEAESDEVRQSLRRARSAHRVALLYLHRVAEAGGYRKYERMRRAAVMAMAVRSSKLPAALEIWVQHVADSFPDPLEERRPRGARIRLGS